MPRITDSVVGSTLAVFADLEGLAAGFEDLAADLEDLDAGLENLDAGLDLVSDFPARPVLTDMMVSVAAAPSRQRLRSSSGACRYDWLEATASVRKCKSCALTHHGIAVAVLPSNQLRRLPQDRHY